MSIEKLIKDLDNLDEKLSQTDIDKMTDEEVDAKYEENYQNFITGLEKLSKKYGIALSAAGCFRILAVDGFKEIVYRRDSSSGDLNIEKVIGQNGEDLMKEYYY